MEPTLIERSPCFRVFEIPELVYSICALASGRDNVNLLRVCRQLFNCVRPFVWEHTNSGTLISMIPGIEMVIEGDAILPSCTVMTLPRVIDTSRLNVYAPSVKRLDIVLDVEVEDLEYEDWDQFLAFARTTKLLPNLTHANVRLTGRIQDGGRYEMENVINWVTFFLSPSLLSLAFALHNLRWISGAGNSIFPWLDSNKAHSFLGDVCRQCPLLQYLEIPPSNVKGVDRDNNGGSSGPNGLVPGSVSQSAISNFNHLRSLTTSTFILNQDVFLGISRLPLLGSLVVCGQYLEKTIYGSGLTLPCDSFLALRRLELRFVAWPTTQHLIRQPLLLRNLHELKIHGFQYNLQIPSGLFSSIISQVADHRPRIANLHLSTDGEQGCTFQLITLQMIKSLEVLPLRRLYLGMLSEDHSNLEGLIRAVPELEDFTITSYGGYHPSQLQKIITLLPRVHRLSLNMGGSAFEEISRLGPPSSPLVRRKIYLASDFQISLGVTITNRDPEVNPGLIARYLYALNPNIEYEGLDWAYNSPEKRAKLIRDALSGLKDGQVVHSG